MLPSSNGNGNLFPSLFNRSGSNLAPIPISGSSRYQSAHTPSTSTSIRINENDIRAAAIACVVNGTYGNPNRVGKWFTSHAKGPLSNLVSSGKEFAETYADLSEPRAWLSKLDRSFGIAQKFNVRSLSRADRETLLEQYLAIIDEGLSFEASGPEPSLEICIARVVNAMDESFGQLLRASVTSVEERILSVAVSLMHIDYRLRQEIYTGHEKISDIHGSVDFFIHEFYTSLLGILNYCQVPSRNLSTYLMFFRIYIFQKGALGQANIHRVLMLRLTGSNLGARVSAKS